MNITINRPALSLALKRAKAIADAKSTMPALARVLLRTDGRTLTLTATDLNVSSVVEVACAGDKGAVAVPAAQLAALIDSLPGDEVRLADSKASPPVLTVSAGRVKATVPLAVKPADFPKVAAPPDGFAAVDGAHLRDLLGRTLPSVCTDETRFHLHGVYLEQRGAVLRAVSTDGHRLALVDRPAAGFASGLHAIVPRKGAIEIQRLAAGLATVEIALAAPHFFVRSNGTTIAVKLIDATFPTYEQVIPKKHATRVIADRAAVLDAFTRAGLMAGETTGIVLAATAEGLRVTCTNPDRGDVTEDVTAEVAGPDVRISAAPGYLRDALGACTSDQIAIEMGGPLDPVAIRPLPGDDLFVVMPMRI